MPRLSHNGTFEGGPATQRLVITWRAGSLWRNLRLRRAVNLAVNREDLIRYAAKGNGEIIPALVPRQGLGYDPDLPAYPFDPNRAWQLRRDAQAILRDTWSP